MKRSRSRQRRGAGEEEEEKEEEEKEKEEERQGGGGEKEEEEEKKRRRRRGRRRRRRRERRSCNYLYKERQKSIGYLRHRSTFYSNGEATRERATDTRDPPYPAHPICLPYMACRPCL